MEIEKEIFARMQANFKKIEEYGFRKVGEVYQYSYIFLDNFRADITIDGSGMLIGKVYDLTMDCEYINFRIESQTGEFVSSVRESYKNLLEDIKVNCFEKLYFVSDQANRVTQSIMEYYYDEPVFLWESAKDHGVFKNDNNDKWYALIMYVDGKKIDEKLEGKVEAINIKLSPLKIIDLLKRKGFYPAYHMNKKNWITIVLDDTLQDEEIMGYVRESHSFTETTSNWLIPANPKYYDVISRFNQKDVILWRQPNGIRMNDKVYLYLGSPYSAILFQCQVIGVDIPSQYQDENSTTSKTMKIKLLKRYRRDEYTFAKLKEYGIRAIRGPRHMPENLEKELC